MKCLISLRKAAFFFLIFFLLSVPSLAVDVETSYLHRYSLEGNGYDANNTLNLTGSPDFSTDAKEGIFSGVFGAGKNLTATGAGGWTGGNSPVSISFWTQHDAITSAMYYGGIGAYTTTGTMFFMSTTNATRINMLGIGNDLSFDVPERSNGVWYHYAFVYQGNKSVFVYQDGTLVATGVLSNNQNLNTNKVVIGKDHVVGGSFVGHIDDFRIYNYALSDSQIYNIFSNPNGSVESTPFAHVRVLDAYDNATIDGATVCLTTDNVCNTTVSGVAYFYNYTGQEFNVSDTNYFTTTGTAVENSTTNAYVYGAFVTLNVTDLSGYVIQNYSAYTTNLSSPANTTTISSMRVLLKPLTACNITIQAFDGNYSVNSTNQTYINKTFSVTPTGQDLGTYNLTDLYQSFLTLNVSLGTTTTYLSNHTANITGPVNYTNVNTTDYTTTYYLLVGNYSATVLPDGYSYSYKNFTIDYFNFTPYITVSAYAINSFYINFLDEITTNSITETVTLELISDASSGNYSTPNGSISLELLTPADYTLRYRASSYPERDYYQTLVDNNYYDIKLYGINGSVSYGMIVTVLDTLGDPIEGAQVQLRRYFVGTNSYEVVEMAETSYNGQAYMNAQAYEAHYKIAVVYGGRTLLTNTPENFVPETSGLIEKVITFNTGTDYYSSYQTLPDVARTLVYNNETATYSFSWNDPSGLVTAGCFYADYANGTSWTRLSNCQNSSNGNVLLTLPDPTNTSYRYQAIIFTSTNYSEYPLFTGFKTGSQLQSLGAVGNFFGVMIIAVLGIGGAFIGAVGALVGAFIGVIFVSLIKLLPFGWSFITGFVALGAGMAIYLMRR